MVFVGPSRISPVYLLVTGYAATWWARAGSGPQWASAVGAESAACRRKFWSHAFYVNNLLHPEDICLVQTWSVLSLLAVMESVDATP